MGAPPTAILMWPAAGRFETVDHRLHVGHGRGEQRAHADDGRVALVGRGHELLDALIDADIVHFEARALGHHADQVLADVVQIAAHRAHQQNAGRL